MIGTWSCSEAFGQGPHKTRPTDLPAPRKRLAVLAFCFRNIDVSGASVASFRVYRKVAIVVACGINLLVANFIQSKSNWFSWTYNIGSSS